MKTYKVKENRELVFDFGTKCEGFKIIRFNEISDIEFNLLLEDIDSEFPYKQEEFVFCEFQDGSCDYVLKKDIEETEYFTTEQVKQYALDLLQFLTDHDEIAYNPVLKKWDTKYGKGYQNNEELIKFFEANKSKLNVNQYTELLQNMREDTFHMNDEQAKEVVGRYVENFPDLLRYRDIEWFYKNV